MPVKKRGARRKWRELTYDQTFELLIGPHSESAFESEAARAAAWAAHGADLKADHPGGGINPLWGEIRYDGAAPPGWQTDTSWIDKAKRQQAEVAKRTKPQMDDGSEDQS